MANSKHYCWKKWLTLTSVNQNFEKLLALPTHTHTHKLVKCNYSSQGNCAEKKLLFCLFTSKKAKEEKMSFLCIVPIYLHRTYIKSYTGKYQWLRKSYSSTVWNYFLLEKFSLKTLFIKNNKTNKKEILKSQFFFEV